MPFRKRQCESQCESPVHGFKRVFVDLRKNEFAENLIETGITQFIVQPFHLTRGKFVVGTRDAALQKIEEKLKSSSAENYGEHYREAFEVLQRQLNCWDRKLGIGKEGFRPPF